MQRKKTDRFTKAFNVDDFDYEILFDEMVCNQVPDYLKLMEEIFKNYRTATVRGFKDAKIKIAKQRRDLEEKFSKKINKMKNKLEIKRKQCLKMYFFFEKEHGEKFQKNI